MQQTTIHFDNPAQLLLREDTEPVRKEKRKKRREDVESGKIDPMFY